MSDDQEHLLWGGCKHGLPRSVICAECQSELAPVTGSGAAVECEESVILKIRQRRDAGRRKYGTSMERTDLTKLDWLRHAQEEAMDLAIYLEKLIQAEQQQNNQAQRPGSPDAGQT